MLTKSEEAIIKKGKKARDRRLKIEAKQQDKMRKRSISFKKRKLLKNATIFQKLKLKLKWAIWKKSEREL